MSSSIKRTLNALIGVAVLTIVSAGLMMNHSQRTLKCNENGACISCKKDSKENEGEICKKKQLVLAIEFADTPSDINNSLALWPAEGQTIAVDAVELVKALCEQIYYDYPFLVLYSLFFALLAYLFYQKSNQKIFLSGIVLGLFMLIGDAVENYQMLRILEDGAEAVDASTYTRLNFFTWLKWGSISLIFLLLGRYYLLEIKWQKVLLGLICFASFIAGAITFYVIEITNAPVEACSEGMFWAQLNFMSIFLGMLALLIDIIVQRVQMRS